MRDLDGKTAFVTGGDSGIGLGIAEVLCDQGMQVYICGLTEESVSAATDHLSPHGKAEGLVLDVRDRAALAGLADRIDREHGGLDVLVNNAGVGFLASALKATFEQWDWVVDINLTGVYNGVRTFVPRMLASGRPGHVVSTASIAGLVGAPGTVYSASKFGVVGLMESLALELEGSAIGVSVLVPGLVATKIQSGPVPPGGPVVADLPPRPPNAAAVQIMQPRHVGERVLDAIVNDELYVLTHAEHAVAVQRRSDALARSFPVEEVDAGRADREARIVANPTYERQHPAG